MSSEPMWLAIVSDAIAASPRSPFENDLALWRAARVLVDAHVLRELHGPALDEARTDVTRVFQGVAAAIRRRDYQQAYRLLDGVPTKLRLKLN